MQNNTAIIYKDIEDKTITWFENSNQYIVLEKVTATIVKSLQEKIVVKKIATTLSLDLEIPLEDSLAFVKDVQEKIMLPNTENTKELTVKRNFTIPKQFSLTNYYLINKLVFQVDFETEYEQYLIHPKFAYLETEKITKPHFHYQVFTQKKHTLLVINDTYIGAWTEKDIHYFQGKFSMQVVQNMHQKKEKEWLGVFHASAVSNGKNSMLFLGDSGNGKSTSLALLQANGFDCLADDFVPVDGTKKEVYRFPSAISIKKNSVPHLLSFYPELADAAEFHFKELNKIVRFLPPKNPNLTSHLPCKALVFIKYKKDSPLIINSISKLDAFQKLIPDSWLSPIKKNANTFLDWFENLPCYELIYSENEKMITTVSNLFADDV